MSFPPSDISADNNEGVFERCSWFYRLCREQLFADHTEEIARSMAPVLCQERRPLLLELGCGPGFYSYHLAKRFPQVDVIGIDPSQRLLTHARQRIEREALENCRFIRARAHQLAGFPEEADFIIASRLFLILANRSSVLEAIYVALRPTGLLFIAEPLSPVRAALPLTCMRILQALTARGGRPKDFAQCSVIDKPQFADFVASQPWKHVRHWSDERYQYALCEKAA